MALKKLSRSYGAQYAGLTASLRDGSGSPARCYAAATGGLLHSDGNFVLDATGGFTTFVDDGRLYVLSAYGSTSTPVFTDLNLEVDATVDGSSVGSVSGPWNLLGHAISRLYRIPSFGLSSVSDRKPAFPTLPWVGNYSYASGAVRSNSGKLYLAKTGGVSASSGGPTTVSQLITDGTVVWRYIGDDPHAWGASKQYQVPGEFCSNLGSIYVVVSPGTSSASGGPNANSTSITDNTVTWCRIQLRWIDSVFGSDANPGTSPISPIKTFPNALGNSSYVASCNDNTVYFVAAGSSISVDFRTTPNGIGITTTRCGVTVYDRNTGNEIVDQPNPYERALLGKWISDDEKTSKYFRIIGNAGAGVSADLFPGTNGKGIVGSASGTTGLVRGAYITGCPYAAITLTATGNITVEDCVIEDNAQLGTVTDDGADGCGVRVEGASTGVILRRLFISGSGEDGVWMAADPGPTGFTIEDLAIYHKPTQSAINFNHHCDGIQFGRYPGASVLRRVVIEHDVSNLVFANSQPIGAGLIIDSTGTSGSNDLSISDIVVVSNSQCTNIYSQCASISNSMFVTVRNYGDAIDRAYVHVFNVAQHLNGCVSGYVGGVGRGDVFYSGAAPVLTNSSVFTE